MGLSIDEIVGDYRVIGVIGTGGMGTVYKVQHLISDRIEAMKVALPDLEGSPELADRFIREIRVQASLNHPNIASLHNALRQRNQLLMVMEYVEGTTLHVRLQHGAIDTGSGLDIVVHVLRALAYAHEKGVVHRDVKPANIMLASGGVVKLMDFGIAKKKQDVQITHTGVAVGSVAYMSPEQVRGDAVDGRSDLYSAGVMLYEMMTGSRPIVGESSWAVMNGHLRHVPRSPSTLNPALPASLSLAILRALEKSPGERFQSAGEFADLLVNIQKRTPMLQVGSGQTMTAAPVPVQVPAVRETPIASRPMTPPPEVPPVPEPEMRPQATPKPEYPSTPTPSEAKGRFDADHLERIRRELAVYMGPMAKVIVNRAAKRAMNWHELYEMLSADVPEGKERDRFLAGRPRGHS